MKNCALLLFLAALATLATSTVADAQTYLYSGSAPLRYCSDQDFQRGITETLPTFKVTNIGITKQGRNFLWRSAAGTVTLKPKGGDYSGTGAIGAQEVDGVTCNFGITLTTSNIGQSRIPLLMRALANCENGYRASCVYTGSIKRTR